MEDTYRGSFDSKKRRGEEEEEEKEGRRNRVARESAKFVSDKLVPAEYSRTDQIKLFVLSASICLLKKNSFFVK